MNKLIVNNELSKTPRGLPPQYGLQCLENCHLVFDSSLFTYFTQVVTNLLLSLTHQQFDIITIVLYKSVHNIFWVYLMQCKSNYSFYYESDAKKSTNAPGACLKMPWRFHEQKFGIGISMDRSVHLLIITLSKGTFSNESTLLITL